MHVTFVKKILENGELCPKCNDVSERLQSDGLIEFINHISIADLRDKDSEGVRLAQKHEVARAPFFLVKEDDEEVVVFDVYFKFKKYIEGKNLIQAKTVSL